jgi:hypothetical protein
MHLVFGDSVILYAGVSEQQIEWRQNNSNPSYDLYCRDRATVR